MQALSVLASCLLSSILSSSQNGQKVALNYFNILTCFVRFLSDGANVGGRMPWEEPQFLVSLMVARYTKKTVKFGENTDISEIPWISG